MMNRKVLIFGAGSIGNHHSYAARNLEMNVTVFDNDPIALERMKNQIYPSRYGIWDELIYLTNDIDTIVVDFYDLVIIGTPPDSHLSLLEIILDSIDCKIILIEKPFSNPMSESALNRIKDKIDKSTKRVLVAYNHRLTKLTSLFLENLSKSELQYPQFVSCVFQESWDGIFRAHPWLSGPEESYLGSIDRGGGAAFEHSHALNFFFFIVNTLNPGKLIDFSQHGNFTRTTKLSYDHHYSAYFRFENKISGIVIQDVITEIHKKFLKIEFLNGSIEWIYCYDESNHAVITTIGKKVKIEFIEFSRPDDFSGQMEHILKLLDKNKLYSPLDFETNLFTQRVLNKYYLQEIGEHKG